MTEIMPVPRNLILLSYQQGALRLSFLSLYSSLPLGAITTRRLGSSPSLYVIT